MFESITRQVTCDTQNHSAPPSADSEGFPHDASNKIIRNGGGKKSEFNMMCVEIRLVSRGLFVVDCDSVEVESEARMEMICEQVFSRVQRHNFITVAGFSSGE